MKTRAYDKLYLEDTMTVLGGMLDYAVNGCGEELNEFYARFLGCGIAREFSRATPKYMGMSGVELALEVSSRTGRPLPEKEPYVDPGSPEFWTGWLLAYLSWNLDLDFETLQQKGVTVEDVFSSFHPLHEAGLDKAVETAQGWIRGSVAREHPLKRQRKRAGLTQRALADLSGTPLRVIRSYEQGQRSLGSASVDTVRRLCRVLACRQEDIL